MKEAAAIAGGIVGMIVLFTLLASGKFSVGTSAQGPFASLGFSGPQSR